jgi:hypothetical protein
LPRQYLVGGCVAAVVWTAFLGAAVARAHMYWGDEGYFLTQLRTGLVFHRQIYTQFEFAYGPLLFYWPALCIRALTPLGFSFTAGYLVSLAAMQAAGVGLLFYMVQALPLRRSLKAAAFVLITFGALNSLLGLNYSLFRFILPFALAVLLTRQRSFAKAALVAGFGELACLATSPELGLAFGAAAVVYAAYRALAGRRLWLGVTLAPVLAAASFLAMMGPSYLFTLGNMAKGGFNLLLTPAPHIVALLVATVALAPLAVAHSLRRSCRSPLVVMLYVASLALIPAALGRCDPIHTFVDGIGIYLLSFVAINPAARPGRRAWVLVVALIFVFTQVKNFRLYQYRLSLVLRVDAVQEDAGFDEAALRRIIGDAQITTPLLAPQRIIDDLTSTGQYVPDYFCAMVGVWDHAAEARKISDMRRAPYALVALTDPPEPTSSRSREIALAMRMGFATHPPKPDYLRGELVERELTEHWMPLVKLEDYVLYKRRD